MNNDNNNRKYIVYSIEAKNCQYSSKLEHCTQNMENIIRFCKLLTKQ